jgi:hypothetical protein
MKKKSFTTLTPGVNVATLLSSSLTKTQCRP